VRKTIAAARAAPSQEALLIARLRTDDQAVAAGVANGGGGASGRHVVGTIRVEVCAAAGSADGGAEDGGADGDADGDADGGVCAEVGFFSVDPDMQARGIGGRLLSAAERHAQRALCATACELWVLTGRADIITWYERKGYVRTEQTAPFPPAEANVGTPRVAGLEFVRLVKPL
jgi:GNAT superfamily N-acetyltransferase